MRDKRNLNTSINSVTIELSMSEVKRH